MIQVHSATIEDRDRIRDIYLDAFPDGEGESVAGLALELLGQKATPETLSLKAVEQGRMIAHASFSPVAIDHHEGLQGYILAPLAVAPGSQKQGVGTLLIEHGRQALVKRGVAVVFVYGDPAYYGRFGFSADNASRFSPPYPLQYPFGWLALNLDEYDIAGAPFSIACVPALRDPALW